jgi:short-subunit dehydrogenase
VEVGLIVQAAFLTGGAVRLAAAPHTRMAEQKTQRVALVTGAGRGIGRATALALAREGYALCLAARSFDELEETRRLSGLEPARSLIVLIDLAGENSPQELFDAALEHFGQIDVLINNAGGAPPRTPLLKTSAATQDRILAVNLRAPIALARLAAARMVKNGGGGAIVNIASAAARSTPPGEAVYAAAKAGLIAFSRAAFAELRSSGVKLSVIIPGLVDTALIPHNKHLDRTLMLAAEDVAEAVMTVLRTPARACPAEIVLEPQHNPERAR